MESDPTETINKVLKISRMAPFGGHTMRGEQSMQTIFRSSSNFANSILLDEGSKFESMEDMAMALEMDT